MTDDPVDPNQQDDDGGGGGRGPNLPGGGGGLMSLLPMLLGLFKGKGIILLLVIVIFTILSSIFGSLDSVVSFLHANALIIITQIAIDLIVFIILFLLVKNLSKR